MRRTHVIFGVICALALFGSGAAVAGASSSHQPNGGYQPNAAPHVVGSPLVTEAAYVAITPCRIADTRVRGGMLRPTAVRNFLARGAKNLSVQGGRAQGCGIPVSATGISLSMTTVDNVADGYLVAFPTGAPAPVATSMNFYAKKRATTTLSVKLGAAAAGDFSVRDDGAAASLVLDVSGYFAPPMSAYINADGTIVQSTGRVLSAARPQGPQDPTGRYVVTLDRDVTGCNVLATPISYNYVVATTPGPAANQVQVYIRSESDATPDAPTYHDDSFFINVLC